MSPRRRGVKPKNAVSCPPQPGVRRLARRVERRLALRLAVAACLVSAAWSCQPQPPEGGERAASPGPGAAAAARRGGEGAPPGVAEGNVSVGNVSVGNTGSASSHRPPGSASSHGLRGSLPAADGSLGAKAATPSSSVGHLEGAAALEPLFRRLKELESKGSGAVRVLQLGDSHTASDYGTSVLRRRLQARFGDAGRGFIPLGEPYKRLFQDGELTSSGVDFRPEEVRPGRAGDGRYGLGGIAMVATKPTARMVSRYGASAASLELAYLEQPGGGSFDLLVDGKVLRIETRQPAVRSAFRLLDVDDKPHTVEVRARGDGEVRIFGIALESRRPGIVVDSLGINGAKAHDALGLDEPHVVEQLRHRGSALVIFAYGTNECGDGTSPEEHERALVALAGRVQRAGGAACLFLGPPDRAARGEHGWVTMPKLEAILAAQRRAAAAAGCAFYDQLAAMGGPGTIHTWAGEPKPRARKDHVHLTRDGYALLAGALAGDLLAAYEAWAAASPR